MLKLRKNKKGFTLVELIVVIAIMAVLAGTVAGVTVSQLNKQTNKSAQSEVDALMNDFKSFMLDYKIETGKSLTDAVKDFAKEAKETKGLSKEILVESGTPKAGEHQFKYSVNDKTVTFSCTGKGTGTEIKATYEYKDILGD